MSHHRGTRDVGDPGRPRPGLRQRVRQRVPAPVRQADAALFRAVARRRLPVVGPVLTAISQAANRSRLWMLAAGIVAAIGGPDGRRAARRALLALAVTSAFVNVPAKLLADRPRPLIDPVPVGRRSRVVPRSSSFPSGHAASAFAFATAAALEMPRLRTPLFVLAAAVGASRVTTGVHYPGDVLVGAAVGAGIARGLQPSPARELPPATGAVASVADWPDADGTGLVVVVNEAAGDGEERSVHDALAELLPGAAVVEVDPDTGLLASLRAAADRARVLGVVGGDGTANAAALVARASDVPLAILPGGTLNRLSTTLGVSDVDAIHAAIGERRAVHMDLGTLDGHVFCNAAAIGHYPHLVARREALEDRIGKWPAAVWCALHLLATMPPLQLELDGRPRVVWHVVVGNGRFVDDGPAPTDRVRLDSGQLDVRVVAADVPWSRTRLAAAALVGRLDRASIVERWPASPSLDVRSRAGPLRLARDGEWWDAGEHVRIEIAPAAIVVLQPRGRDRT